MDRSVCMSNDKISGFFIDETSEGREIIEEQGTEAEVLDICRSGKYGTREVFWTREGALAARAGVTSPA